MYFFSKFVFLALFLCGPLTVTAAIKLPPLSDFCTKVFLAGLGKHENVEPMRSILTLFNSSIYGSLRYEYIEGWREALIYAKQELVKQLDFNLWKPVGNESGEGMDAPNLEYIKGKIIAGVSGQGPQNGQTGEVQLFAGEVIEVGEIRGSDGLPEKVAIISGLKGNEIVRFQNRIHYTYVKLD